MTLIIRLKTDKTPSAFAAFDLELKDGSVIRVNAVLERIEKVAVWYRCNKEIRAYDVKDVIYDGSDCTPDSEDSKQTTVYALKAVVADPCLIKESAKLIVVYNDGSREEVCGKYAGISVYYAEYKSCVDVDADKVLTARLASMGPKV
jgi:hypothetical protein